MKKLHTTILVFYFVWVSKVLLYADGRKVERVLGFLHSYCTFLAINFLATVLYMTLLIQIK